MTGYYEKYLSYPKKFSERKCKVCCEKFTPLYFDNETCHVCVEERLRREFASEQTAKDES